MNFTDLETKRMNLKLIAPEDKDFVFKHFSSEAVYKYLYDEEPMKTMEEAEDLINFYLYTIPEIQNRWVLNIKDTGEKIGTCGFHRWNKEAGIAEIGYDLSSDYWGQGFMSEAVEAALNFADENMKVRRVMAHIFPGNKGSVNLALRTGFKYLGEDTIYTFRGIDYVHNVYVYEM